MIYPRLTIVVLLFVKINFYTTLGCHLCDQALDLVKILQVRNSHMVVTEIDIADSEELMAEYGIRIPVVKLEATDDDIGWPFTLEALADYLGEHSAGASLNQ